MENAIDLPTVVLMPADQAMFIAFTFGLLLGTALVIYDVSEDIVNRRLNTANRSLFKSLLFSFLIAFSIIVIFTGAIRLLFPDKAVRFAHFDEAIEALGDGLFFFINIITMFAVSILGRFIRRQMTGH